MCLSGNQVLTAEDSSRKVSFEYGGLGDLLSRKEADRSLSFFYDKERQLRTVRNERDDFEAKFDQQKGKGIKCH